MRANGPKLLNYVYIFKFCFNHHDFSLHFFNKEARLYFSFSNNQLLTHLEWHLDVFIKNVLLIYTTAQQITYFIM
jgi:hypothetical protein